MTELFSWTQMQHQDINCHLLSYGDYVASKISVVSLLEINLNSNANLIMKYKSRKNGNEN